MTDERIAQLLKFLERDPADSFTLFALAMEYANKGDADNALLYFDKLLQAHPNYAAAYYHKGQLLLRTGRLEEAKQCFQAGIPVAREEGELHTRDKLQEALDSLQRQGH